MHRWLKSLNTSRFTTSSYVLIPHLHFGGKKITQTYCNFPTYLTKKQAAWVRRHLLRPLPVHLPIQVLPIQRSVTPPPLVLRLFPSHFHHSLKFRCLLSHFKLSEHTNSCHHPYFRQARQLLLPAVGDCVMASSFLKRFCSVSDLTSPRSPFCFRRRVRKCTGHKQSSLSSNWEKEADAYTDYTLPISRFARFVSSGNVNFRSQTWK